MNTGTLTLTSSTVVSNTTGMNSGGGLRNIFTATLVSTIVAGNVASNTVTNPDIDAGYGDAVYVSLGHNLIGVATGISGFGVNDQVGTSPSPIDPLLGPLQDNGGDTPTHAPRPGSPAIGFSNCSLIPPADQRGVSRPPGAACDTGAVEIIYFLYLALIRR